MQEDFLEKSGIHTREPSERENDYPSGFAVVRPYTFCSKVKLNVDVVDVSGGEVRVEVIKAPHLLLLRMFCRKEPVPRHLLGREDVVPDEDFQRFIL